MTLRKTQFGGRVHWGKPFDVNTRHLASKEVIHLSPNPPPLFFKKSIMLNVIIKQYYWHNVEGNFQQLQKALSCLPYLHLLGV